MDRLTAVEHIRKFIHECDDVALAEALQVIMTPPPPLGGLGRVAREAAELSSLVAKTGELSEWHTPPQHSQAMERLIHRLTNLLEAFLDMVTDESDYLPLVVELWRMVVQDKATATDLHAAIFNWSTNDVKLRGALQLRGGGAAAALPNNKETKTS